MYTRLINIWDNFRSSFWFIPMLMILCALMLAILACQIDLVFASTIQQISWLSTTADAARTTLSSLASAMIALVGVVFSVTVVTLSIASSQFGSRIIRYFMSRGIADWVIGAFIGTSLYCLLVLRTVREQDGSATLFVPQFATAVGSLLGLLCIVLLVVYIHNVATSIQAPMLIQMVSAELDASLDRIFPEKIGDAARGDEHQDEHQTVQQKLDSLGNHHDVVKSNKEGYIEGIDGDSLITLAQERSVVIALDCQPGDFVIQGQTLARIWRLKPNNKADHFLNDLDTAFHLIFVTGPYRTPRQDVGCAVRALVEIAIRALSPGINDPYTAMSCVDRLTAALCRLAHRAEPERIRKDSEKQERVLVTQFDGFTQLLNLAFGQIQQYSHQMLYVTQHLLKSMQKIASAVQNQEQASHLMLRVHIARSGLSEQNLSAFDQEQCEAEYRKIVEILESRSFRVESDIDQDNDG